MTEREEGSRVSWGSLLLLNGALVLSSLTALFAKMVSLPVHQIIFGRSGIASLSLLCFLKLTRRPIALAKRKDYFYLLGSGGLLGLHWVTYFLSIKMSTVAMGIIALYTYPVITIILEPVFDKSRHSLMDLGLGVIVFFGVFLMAPEYRLDNRVTQGVVWGVLSAAIYSVRNILVRRHLRSYSAPTVMFYQTASTAVLLLPTLWYQAEAFDASQLELLLVLGIVFTALHHTLIAKALGVMKVKTVSIISTIQPIYGAALAYLILYEIPQPKTLLGGGIVLFVAFYEASVQMKRKD